MRPKSHLLLPLLPSLAQARKRPLEAGRRETYLSRLPLLSITWSAWPPSHHLSSLRHSKCTVPVRVVMYTWCSCITTAILSRDTTESQLRCAQGWVGGTREMHGHAMSENKSRVITTFATEPTLSRSNHNHFLVH